MIDISFTSKYV